MQYLIYPNHQDAVNRSFDIATEQGCTDNVTMYWFGVINHPTNNEAAMQIPEGEENKLTSQEQSQLVSQEYMDGNGWFPPFPTI
jgi:hypothetical protein